MITRYGIVSADWYRASEDYKQFFLPFDKIYMPDLPHMIENEAYIESDEQKFGELLWLVDQGVIESPPFDVLSDDIGDDEICETLADHFLALTEESSNNEETDEMLSAFQWLVAKEAYLSRLCAYIAWRDLEEIAIPINFNYPLDNSPVDTQFDVLSIALSYFPHPSEEVPLKDLIAFKKDPETNYKFGKFWEYIRNISLGEMPKSDIHEAMDSAVREYEHQVARLDSKYKNQRIEFLISSPFEILDDLLKFKFGSTIRKIFEFRKFKVAAYEEELKAPGSELAYIVEANKTFEGGSQ